MKSWTTAQHDWDQTSCTGDWYVQAWKSHLAHQEDARMVISNCVYLTQVARHRKSSGDAESAVIYKGKERNDDVEKLEDYSEQSNKTGVPMDVFVMQNYVNAMTSNETMKVTPAMVIESIKDASENNIADAIQVRYTSAKEGMGLPVFLLVKEALIQDIQQDHLDTLLVRNVDKLAESEIFMDALTQRMIGSSVLTKCSVQVVERRMKKLMRSSVWTYDRA